MKKFNLKHRKFQTKLKFDIVVQLVGGWSVINGATLSSF